MAIAVVFAYCYISAKSFFDLVLGLASVPSDNIVDYLKMLRVSDDGCGKSRIIGTQSKGVVIEVDIVVKIDVCILTIV